MCEFASFLTDFAAKTDVHLAYMGMEFAWSFCLSQTNSLYLLLTRDIFLVKHTLVVWIRRSRLHEGWGGKKKKTVLFVRSTHV